MIAEIGGPVAGGLVAYRIGDAPEPLDELPPLFRPLQALENRAPGTHYVNVLATYPAFRRRGVASRLLAEAERQGAGARGLSLIVADRNAAARRLYEALRLRRGAAEPIVKEGWRTREPDLGADAQAACECGPRPGGAFKSAGKRATFSGGGF